LGNHAANVNNHQVARLAYMKGQSSQSASGRKPGRKSASPAKLASPPKVASPPRPRARALRLHGTIARKLGIAIVSGRYQPGDLLDGEIASSEQFEVSRTAYREAVRILAAKGLVDARPKVGTRINPQLKWNLLDPDVLDWTFESEPDLQFSTACSSCVT
jgi:hypothetical protein